MDNGRGSLHPDLVDIECAVASAVIDTCDKYAEQQVRKRFLYGDVVHAAIGKALLYAGAKYLGEAIGETNVDKAVEPVEQCLRRYWRMADAILKEQQKTCKTRN